MEVGSLPKLYRWKRGAGGLEAPVEWALFPSQVNWGPDCQPKIY
jgi:hypothetical protein